MANLLLINGKQCYIRDMDDEITELQIKVAYLEDKIESLNAVVVEQQSAVAMMEKKFQFLEKRLENVEEEDRPDRRPPHY